MSSNPDTYANQAGSSPVARALGVATHVVLVLLVLGQIVYLASRYRVRVDMTSDRLWTSTDSTRQLLDKLEQRLVVEAYFSPKEELPVVIRQTRVWADNFLDELTQLGKGKVVVQRFDPNSDKAVADKATRAGVQPQNLRSQSATSVSLDQHWQGLRLRYGEKQAVVPQFLPQSSFLAEALVTPKLKELMTAEKRRFGYMEWPGTAVGQQKPGGIGWSVVRTHEGLAKRYEFQNFKDEDGALLPDDLDTLFLFRPKDLTDRQKYVLDQFVVGGGTLVVFADAAEYAIGAQRLFTKLPLNLDASGSERQFVRQLEHYGVDWRPKVVMDLAPQATAPRDPFRAAFEYFSVPVPSTTGMTQSVPIAYPYFFHPVDADWAQVADQLARDASGKVDAELAQRYRETFVPGMPSDDFLFQVFKKLKRGPGFYWPTWVGLRQRAGGKLDLPQGVEGRVLLWSSPAALVEDPQQSVDPVGRDPLQRRAQLDKFNLERNERLKAEPRQQAPLMVEVKGRFASYFAGMERPKRPSEIQEEEARKKSEPADEPPKDEEKPGGNADEGPQPAKPTDDEATVSPLAQERAMKAEGDRPGRIVMIGDATFLRDDVVRGDYQQVGGPVSGTLAMPFFAQLLDWLSEDQDLVALQSRAPADRTLSFVDASAGTGVDPRDAERRLRTRTRVLVWLNVLVPCGLLAAFGLVVFFVRRGQKRAFLATLN